MFRLSIKNDANVEARLLRNSKLAQKRIKLAVKEYGYLTKELTQLFCPVRSGHMRDHVQVTFPKGGFSYEVGWEKDDFPGAFYPPYQEFGTSIMSAQPSLLPADDEIRPQFLEHLEGILREFAND